MTRSWPISRRNSTVLGVGVRGPTWDLWWNRGANWEAAYPARNGISSACLWVPCREVWEDGDWYWDGTEVFRVRPRNERGRPILIRGVWHWRYPSPGDGS